MTDERITIDEARRRGYIFGKVGYNHAADRRIIAPLETIRRLSSGMVRGDRRRA